MSFSVAALGSGWALNTTRSVMNCAGDCLVPAGETWMVDQVITIGTLSKSVNLDNKKCLFILTIPNVVSGKGLQNLVCSLI